MPSRAKDRFPPFIAERPVLRIDGDGIRCRILRGYADSENGIQPGFVIANYTRKKCPDGAFMFSGRR